MAVASGTVRIRLEKIATAEAEGNLTLFHVPSNRLVVLYPHGRAIWERIASGVNDISELVSGHRDATRSSEDLAAYQVLTFLDELRDLGFLDYEMTSERETFPLLDTHISATELKLPDLLASISAAGEVVDTNRLRSVRVANPSDTASLRELMEHAEADDDEAAPRDASVAVVHGAGPAMSISDLLETSGLALPESPTVKVTVLDRPDPATTLAQLRELPDLPSERRGASLLIDPPPTLSLKDTERLSSRSKRPTSRRGVWIGILIIVIGPIVIIIIVIGDDPGPTFGKSRSSCQTACV